MVKRSYKDLSVISGMWLGLYLEIYSDFRGSVCRFGGLRGILSNDMGLFVRWPGFSGIGFIFVKRDR
jgi:hypothetical protein